MTHILYGTRFSKKKEKKWKIILSRKCKNVNNGGIVDSQRIIFGINRDEID